MNKKLINILIGILVAIMLFLGFKIYQEFPRKEVKVPTKITNEVKAKVKATNPIDFDAYQAINTDVYAYIYIKDSVDTPILQHPENDAYYLDYMLDGTQAYPGAVYTELKNSKEFTDANTIVYGHNDIITNTMFNGNLKFQDPTFFNEHRYMYIYTPTSIYQYELFAAYVNDNSHVYYAVNDWNDPAQYQAYLDCILTKDGNIQKDIKLTSDDRIVTLSTCTEGDDNRYLLQAVLKQKIDCPQTSSIKVKKELMDSKS